MKKLVIFLSLVLTAITLHGQNLYKVSTSSIKFTSDAPLELIQAQSSKMAGLLKISERAFAFSVPLTSFQGFNSDLQRVHFNENYVESDKYPNSTFEGKIIEEINFDTPGKYDIRGKGTFSIHGVTQQRIIKCQIVVEKNKIIVTSKFTVLLADHNIKIPSVVNKKIAEEITVDISATLVPKIN